MHKTSSQKAVSLHYKETVWICLVLYLHQFSDCLDSSLFIFLLFSQILSSHAEYLWVLGSDVSAAMARSVPLVVQVPWADARSELGGKPWCNLCGSGCESWMAYHMSLTITVWIHPCELWDNDMLSYRNATLFQCHVLWYAVWYTEGFQEFFSVFFPVKGGVPAGSGLWFSPWTTLEGPRYPTALHVRGAAGHHSQSPGAVFAFGHFMAMDIGYHVMGSRSSTVGQWSVSPWRHPALNVCPNILPDLSTCFMARSIREPLRCLAAAFFMVPGEFSHCSTWLPATCQRRTSPSCRASTECGPHRIGT